MVQHIKVPVPSDLLREFQAFGGSPAQRQLHNDLVQKLEGARERLENATVPEEVFRIQGEVRAYREALSMLHSRDSVDVAKSLYSIQK